jgi:uncharacterized protein with GYD domain
VGSADEESAKSRWISWPQACEAGGGKLIGGWYCFGDYDLVIIAEVPNNESIAAIAAGGAIKSSQTTILMTGAELLGALK